MQISKAINELLLKFNNLNISELEISKYNQVYLKKYLDNYSFYTPLYAQLLTKAILKLDKPIHESVFIDYGGGSGMLSFLAKEIGFKSVIYNDIYNVSVNDVKIVANRINIPIDHFICGDIDELVNEIDENKIKPDLICSFDVLEHIYNLKNWFKTISKIKNNFSLLFMTSANSKNPFVVKRLKKFQINAEFIGKEKTIGWKERDLNTSFFEARKNIIKKHFQHLKDEEVTILSTKTRGLRKDDIIEIIDQYIKTEKFNYQINHPTNTCDPNNGNWTENLIDLDWLKKVINKNQLNVAITNSYYSYSKNRKLNIPKFALNLMIKILGSHNLFFSPTYTLEVKNY